MDVRSAIDSLALLRMEGDSEQTDDGDSDANALKEYQKG